MARTSPPTPAPFPFPVGTTQVARGLIRVHQYLRGELTKRPGSEEVLVQPEVCHEQMVAIETLLQFLGANFDPTVLKARRAFPKVGPLEYGQVRSGALAALKCAGDWQTCNQVFDDILAAHRLQLTDAERRHFIQKLREALHALKREQAVVCERPGARLGDNTFEQRWRLSSMFA
jgi:hypothetical protein